MDDVCFNAVCAQPARQPQAVAAGLEGDSDACDRATGLNGFIAPAKQQTQQCLFVRADFLLRMPVDPWDDTADQPSFLAQLDRGDDGGVAVEGDEGSAEVV